jgi:hypothetical protein
MSILPQPTDDDIAAFAALTECAACGDLTDPHHRLCAGCAELAAEHAARRLREARNLLAIQARHDLREGLRWAA